MNRQHVKDPLSLGALDKIKILSTVSHRQRSPFGIRLYDAALKRDTSSWGMYYVCNGKTPTLSPLAKEKRFF
ncbi:hypothetical protein TNCV_3971341 [Trichonephila clavipes]|nr:hypothetical protein TNCV_3971341 [Trichonephila clavipes]